MSSVCVYPRADSKYYWVKYKSRGRWVHESSKETDKEKAEEFDILRAADAVRGVKNRVYGKTSFDDLEKAVIDRYEQRGNKTISDAERHLRNLRGFFEGSVTDIDKSLITKYTKKRLKDGLKKATVNRELSTLRLGLNLLDQDDKILKAPKVETFHENNTRQKYLTVPEYQRLVASLRKVAPHLVGPVELAVRTGWRKSTVTSIEWEHIDEENEEIVAPGVLTKNGEPVVFPYAEYQVIQDVIEKARLAKTNGIPYVFLNRKGDNKIKDLRKSWSRAVREAVLGEGYGKGYENGLKFHDLKRTNFVMNEEAGISRSITMEISGTKCESIYRRYNIVDKKRMRKAINKQERFIEEETPREEEVGHRRKARAMAMPVEPNFRRFMPSG